MENKKQKEISDMLFVVPDYLPNLLKKYGSTSVGDIERELHLLEIDKKQNPQVYNFSKLND